MSRYETDDEQLETIKQWWRENGKQLILAAVVAVGGVLSWNYYQQLQHTQAVHASSTFELLQLKAQQGAFQEVAREAEKLKAEYPDSPYASGAALLLATYFYEKKQDVKAALSQLNWAIAHAPEAGMKAVAQLRSARILADQRQFDQAQTYLKQVGKAKLPEAGQALYAYVEGELALFKGEHAAARSAFEKVLTYAQADAGLKQLAQLQLDDLTPLRTAQ